MATTCKVCYTALFGQHEELKEPTVITPGWEYICYTDMPLTSNVWQIVQINIYHMNPRRAARQLKILAFTQWEQSIWIDASFTISVNLDFWWGKHFAKGFSVPKHPQRQCVYDEITACIMVNNEDRNALLKQMDDFYNRPVPKKAGIITSGIIMRENKPEIIELCNAWWREIQKGTLRDQVAFAAIHQQYNEYIHVYNWRYTDKKDFIYKKHFHQR